MSGIGWISYTPVYKGDWEVCLANSIRADLNRHGPGDPRERPVDERSAHLRKEFNRGGVVGDKNK